MPAAKKTAASTATTAASLVAPSLKMLTTKLKEIHSAFHDIWQFMADFTDDTTATQVELRLANIDNLWERFNDTIIEIKSHDDYGEEEDIYEKERREFSNRYYEVKSFLVDKVKELQAPPELDQSVRASDSSVMGTLDHVRLPQIKLQTFNGDIDEWLSFRDLFLSLIHWKAELPDVEKFHYLKGCLQGEPKSLIDPLKITKANYSIAWEMLLKRYNNNKQLKRRQVQSLLKLPTLSKESVSELRTVTESFERIVQTLDQVIQPAEYKDLLLVNLLTTHLDPVTRRGWEEFSSTKEQDTLKDLTEFLQRRIRVLESLPPRVVETKGLHQQLLPPKQRSTAVRTSYNTVQSSGGHCVACKANHLLIQCSAFQRMSVADREALLRKHGLCRNCFKQGHQAKECQSKFSCRNCNGRHHTLLCFRSERDGNLKVAAVAKGDFSATTQDSNEPATSASSQVANVAATEVLVSSPAHQYSSQVLLATAIVFVEDGVGNKFPARALLDSGSESNFITERLSQRMKITREKVDVSVLGIGQASTKVKHRIRALVRSRVSDFTRDLSFLVLQKVTVNLPTAAINTNGWTIPVGIKLADPTFFEPKGVDIVLGIESFFEFFETGRRIPLGEQLPVLNESVFGWVVCGGLSTPSVSLHTNCNVSTTDGLDDLVARFWSCEEVGSARCLSPEEARCEALFTRTVQRETDGRYTVSLPKDEGVLPQLGESRDIAYRRLQGTERRLARDADLRNQYVSFMNEYLRLGHMQKVEGTAQGAVKRCYLPHHPVVKEASTTTKVRVVFDASCKTSSGVSLNDALLVGPVIQDDLRSIILRCRTKQMMIVADVEKMFRQIKVHPEDQPLQSILWRSSPAEEVGTYELNTVTYGTKPAPFLATRTLKQLTVDEEGRYPLAAKAVSEDTYMDDVITGTDNLEEALTLRIQLDDMLKGGGFRLRKWASNYAAILEGVPQDNLAIRALEGINLDPDPLVKTLGLTWMPNTDVFRYQFTIPPVDDIENLSKRRILSIIATLFDPLGLIGATITRAKVFMQQLWTLRDENDHRLSWDQPLPSTVGERWLNFQQQLPILNDIRIDRCVVIPGAISVELHCFSDASEKAYGGCVYIRSQDAERKVMVRLIASKSKVAPLKCQTIPRLELCGALLVAQLYEKVQLATGITAHCFFYTDSTCTLRWIQSNPNTWTPYVGNRVAKIQTLTEGCEWRHVPGLQNPADLISRGISPEDIVNNEFWWHGPSWLQEGPDKWPKPTENLTDGKGEEERRRSAVAATVSSVTEFNDWYIAQCSSYTKLVWRTAIWQRLMKLLQLPKEDRVSDFLTSAELKEAEYTLIRRVQRDVFSDEWKALSKREMVPSRSPLRWFNPFISPEDQLIRVGGRLKHSMESEDTKHPVVLPARHRLTRMLLQQYHERLLHAGPQLMLSVVRLRFWPLGGRSVARQVVHKCQKCFRAKPSAVQQFMGELPAARVTASRPFSQTGVDYFGPVYIKPGPRRTTVKAYVAIFICLCTKAVHIELVSDLSTNRFLQALRRFIARRGRPTDMYSDNGTNFVGARNKLKEFLRLLMDKTHQDTVAKKCAEDGIYWHFNPPSAPHFGGLWEAAVRSAKHHLLRTIGEDSVSIEDMNTLLAQVEGCLNSRPITPLSDDPNDLEPLTPGHFLAGTSLESIEEPNVQKVPINRLEMWQLMQRKLQDFWERWHREYLCQLQGRNKRWRPAIPIKVGRLVVIRDENQPPMRWRMGRIIEVHPGEDGVVRVVTLKTEDGHLKRPVEKICLLPQMDPNQDADAPEIGEQL